MTKVLGISIYSGVKTGCNDAFVLDNETKEALVSEDPKSEEIIKPILRGKDIKRYRTEWAGLWLIDTHNGYDDIPPIKIADYPAIKKHLDEYYSKLEIRQDKGKTPYNLRNCAYHAEFICNKIVYPNMTSFLPFAYDQKGSYTNQKCFIITGKSNLKYLLGYFNSKIAAKWIDENCPKLGYKGRELSKIFFENIPIPVPKKTQEKYIVSLVDNLLSYQKNLSQSRTKLEISKEKKHIDKIDEEINRVFYGLFGLTAEEISLI